MRPIMPSVDDLRTRFGPLPFTLLSPEMQTGFYLELVDKIKDTFANFIHPIVSDPKNIAFRTELSDPNNPDPFATMGKYVPTAASELERITHQVMSPLVNDHKAFMEAEVSFLFEQGVRKEKAIQKLISRLSWILPIGGILIYYGWFAEVPFFK